MRTTSLLILVVAMAALLGCAGRSQVFPSSPGKAFVVHREAFVADAYNCEVVKGEPICWKAKEERVD